MKDAILVGMLVPAGVAILVGSAGSALVLLSRQHRALGATLLIASALSLWVHMFAAFAAGQWRKLFSALLPAGAVPAYAIALCALAALLVAGNSSVIGWMRRLAPRATVFSDSSPVRPGISLAFKALGVYYAVFAVAVLLVTYLQPWPPG